VNSFVDEPSTYQEAAKIPEWQFAMFEEIAALDRTGAPATGAMWSVPRHTLQAFDPKIELSSLAPC
jgi:hypothetical protein